MFLLHQGDDPLWTTRENEEDSVGDNVSEASVSYRSVDSIERETIRNTFLVGRHSVYTHP